MVLIKYFKNVFKFYKCILCGILYIIILGHRETDSSSTYFERREKSKFTIFSTGVITLLRRRVPLFQKCKIIIVVSICFWSIAPFLHFIPILSFDFLLTYIRIAEWIAAYAAVHKAHNAGKPLLPLLTPYILIRFPRLLTAKKHP